MTVITKLKFIFWRFRFAISYERQVRLSTFKDGWQYSLMCQDYFIEGYDPDEALLEDMTYWND